MRQFWKVQKRMFTEGREEGVGGSAKGAGRYEVRMSGMKAVSSDAGGGAALSRDCAGAAAAGTIAAAQDPLTVEPHWEVSQE